MVHVDSYFTRCISDKDYAIIFPSPQTRISSDVLMFISTISYQFIDDNFYQISSFTYFTNWGSVEINVAKAQRKYTR